MSQPPGPWLSAWLSGTDRHAGVRRLILVILIAMVASVGTVRFDFVFDDPLVILADPLVTGPSSLSGVFRSQVHVTDVILPYYRPLITLLYRLDWTLWGTNPAGYHLSNLLWHVLASLLVYVVALRTMRRPMTAWIAAVLFAVLPAHTEAVAWIQGRVDLVSTTFALAALLALLGMREATRPAAWAWGSLAGVALLAALLCKESVAVLPAAWITWEISDPKECPPHRRWLGALARLAPLLAAGGLYWGLRTGLAHAPAGFALGFRPARLRLVGLLAILGEYARVLLFPLPALHFFRALRVVPVPPTALGGAAALGGLVVGLLAAWRRSRSLFPWVAWLPILLVPSLALVLYAPAPQFGFFTAERFLYAPSVGWCILLGALLAHALEARTPLWISNWGAVGLAILIAGYIGLTLLRLQPWADPLDFYRAMGRQPDLPVKVRALVHNNLGELLLDWGDLPAAREEFEAELSAAPTSALPRNNLGVLLIRTGRPADALPWLEQAIRLNPTYEDAYLNLGAAYEALHDPTAALRIYEAGAQRVPQSARLAARLRRARTSAASEGSPGEGRSTP